MIRQSVDLFALRAPGTPVPFPISEIPGQQSMWDPILVVVGQNPSRVVLKISCPVITESPQRSSRPQDSLFVLRNNDLAMPKIMVLPQLAQQDKTLYKMIEAELRTSCREECSRIFSGDGLSFSFEDKPSMGNSSGQILLRNSIVWGHSSLICACGWKRLKPLQKPD